jgi:hypothetical protein
MASDASSAYAAEGVRRVDPSASALADSALWRARSTRARLLKMNDGNVGCVSSGAHHQQPLYFRGHVREEAQSHREERARILPALQPDVSVAGQTARAALPELQREAVGRRTISNCYLPSGDVAFSTDVTTAFVSVS